MTINMGSADRAVRGAIGIVLVVLPLLDVFAGGWAIVSYVLGAVMIATAATSFCPLYTLFGGSTRRKASPQG
ncbi:MAG TPA: DUF2892 domain-containing protein [Longimicrobiales bacterium]|nr:DUF2892 domain-containing protein [Longimicrobiales bacterium]